MHTTLRAPGSSVAGLLAASAFAASYDHVARSPRASASCIRVRVVASVAAEVTRTARAPMARAAAFTADASSLGVPGISPAFFFQYLDRPVAIPVHETAIDAIPGQHARVVDGGALPATAANTSVHDTRMPVPEHVSTERLASTIMIRIVDRSAAPSRDIDHVRRFDIDGKRDSGWKRLRRGLTIAQRSK